MCRADRNGDSAINHPFAVRLFPDSHVTIDGDGLAGNIGESYDSVLGDALMVGSDEFLAVDAVVVRELARQVHLLLDGVASADDLTGRHHLGVGCVVRTESAAITALQVGAHL